MDIYRGVGRGHYSAQHTLEVTQPHCHHTPLVRAIAASPDSRGRRADEFVAGFLELSLHHPLVAAPCLPFRKELHALSGLSSMNTQRDGQLHGSADAGWGKSAQCSCILCQFETVSYKTVNAYFLHMHSWVKQIWILSLFLSENSAWTVGVLDYVSVLRMHPLHKLWALCTCFNSVRIRNITKHEERKLRICENYIQLLA